MGEYAIRDSDRRQIKVGTCEKMYIRYEDRMKIRKEDGTNPYADMVDLHWRLPLPAEDDVPIGDYETEGMYPMPGFQDVMDFSDGDLNAGIIQLTHESGILLNLPCYHNVKLPEVTGDTNVKIFWNGKDPHAIVLAAVKNTKDEGMMAIVECKFCRRAWRMPMGQVLPYVKDEVLKTRLIAYNPAKPTEPAKPAEQVPVNAGKKANPAASLDWGTMF